MKEIELDETEFNPQQRVDDFKKQRNTIENTAPLHLKTERKYRLKGIMKTPRYLFRW